VNPLLIHPLDSSDDEETMPGFKPSTVKAPAPVIVPEPSIVQVDDPE
jgi:hypothetical protein